MRKIHTVKTYCLILLLAIALNFLMVSIAAAGEEPINCSNRYVNLVNPVRGRNLWIDKSLKPLTNQYDLIKKNNFPATWLIQYDVLTDKELLNEVKKFDSSQEVGVFLEVSQIFAEDSAVVYPHSVAWFNPKAVFLSGYSQTERRRLIDKLFKEFKSKFGFFPKSVGAWWIDSYSLNYMKEKYNIKVGMIVADQKTTDNYGVWGQWWGVPYYPAKANVLTPASSKENKLNVVMIQWAQRDPMSAYGDGPKFSNYSLQANDYIRQGKNTEYFNKLVDIYLDCQNSLGQITVGLETGIESVGFINEYKNQLEALNKRSSLRSVTMSEFADRFNSIYQTLPKGLKITFQDSEWDLSARERSNKLLGDSIIYNQTISFPDYFVKDKSNFLDRRLNKTTSQRNIFWFPWFLILSLILLLFSYKNKLLRVWLISMIFALSSFGLILRSFYQFGWKVYFGPKLPFLEFFQALIILSCFLLIWLISKWNIKNKNSFSLWIIPMVFAIDPMLQSLRVSYISGKYYFGFAIDALRFVGFSFAKPFSMEFVNRDFPSFLAAGLLRLDFTKVWDNPWISLILYPLTHIFAAFVLGYLLIKSPTWVKKGLIAILVILFILHITQIFQAEPLSVTPILLQ